MADLTHLDSKALKNFNDHDVSDFSSELDKIRQTDPNGVKSLNDLVIGTTTPDTLQENPVLGIGNMANDDVVGGQSLVKKIKDGATALDQIFVKQKTLFDDMHSSIDDTITTLLKDQGDNLSAIDGEKMLDTFSSVDSDMSSGSASGGGSTTGQ